TNLRLLDCRLTDADVASLAGLALTELDLRRNRLSEAVYAALGGFALRSLRMDLHAVPKALPWKLDTLELGGDQTVWSQRRLKRVIQPGLRRLALHGQVETLEPLRAAEALEELHLETLGTAAARELDALAELPRLKVLTIRDHAAVRDRFPEALGRLDRLTLGFSNVGFASAFASTATWGAFLRR
ncbi:MAG: hypothetical protein AAGE52_40515, partial [Myxococcota bacterium]